MVEVLKKIEKYYKIAIVLVDLVIINIAYIIAFYIKFGFDIPQRNFMTYLEAVPFITIAALVYFDIYGLLKFYRKALYDTIISIVYVVFLLGITTVAITYFNQGFAFPRSVLLTTPAVQFILLLIWKWLVLGIRNYLTTHSRSNLMVVGENREADIIVEKVSFARTDSPLNVKYIVDPSDINTIIKKIKNVDEVLICPGVGDERKMEIISHCIGYRRVVYVVPNLFEISLLNAKLMQFEDVPAFMIDSLELSIEQRFFKRLFDIVLSLIGLLVSLPIFLVLIPTIRLTSPGKAIYTQQRVTKNNKVFNIYKFRTMYEDAETKTGPVISGEYDPRVTPVGRILRKLRLDEIPQLFNVLAGDMSLIGPRPERPYFVEQFSKDIPEYNYRNAVKAGITGYAQLLGKYDTSPEDKLRYDLMYIKNYSLLLDIKLLLQTAKVFFMGKRMFNRSYSNNNAGQSQKAIHF